MWNNEWSWCEWCFVHLGHTYIVVVVAWICVCLQWVEQWLCRREEKGGGRILGWLPPPHLLIRLIVTSLFSPHHFHIIKYSTVSKYSKGWLQASSKILPFYQNKAIPHPPSHCNVPSESSAFLLHIYKVQCVFHNINMTEKYKYMHALPPPPAVLWVLVVAKFLRAPEVCLGAACVCVHKVIIWISSWRDTFRVITWIVNCVESTVDGSDEQMIK